MADREEKSSGENIEPEPIKADAGGAGEGNDPAGGDSKSVPGNLPMIEAPGLAGGEEAGHERPNFETADAIMIASHRTESMMPGAASSQPRSFRFALLAATIALTAGAGALFGSLAASGFSHKAPVMAAIPRTAEARDVVRALKVQAAEIAALKASLEGAARNSNGQFARVAQRLDGLERAQVDPVKIAHIAEAVDRLERRPVGSSPDITGSITPRPLAAAAPAPAPVLNAPILRGWVVQEVHAGRAMVESRYGGMFLVSAGSVIPGLGRIEAIRRQDGQWIVVTASGTITQGQ